MRFSQTALSIAVVLGCCALPAVLAGDTTYSVTADTTSIAGQSGYLDLQLEPGPGATNPVTAGVMQFATDGTLNGAATLTGDATGQLPGALTFDNQTVLNDYFQAMQFGTGLSFQVTLSGPNPLGGPASAFNIYFYAADGTTPLLTSDVDGIAGQILVNADGSTTALNYAGEALSLGNAATPEPAGLLWVGAALLLGLGMWRRKFKIA